MNLKFIPSALSKSMSQTLGIWGGALDKTADHQFNDGTAVPFISYLL
jgi:hypothetical protein